MGDTLSCQDLVGFGLASEHFPRQIHQNILLLYRAHFTIVRPPRAVRTRCLLCSRFSRGREGWVGDLQGGASYSSCTRSDREGVTWLNKEKVGVALILPSQACQQQTAWRLPVPTRATSDKSNLCQAGRAGQGGKVFRMFCSKTCFRA